MTTLHCMFNAVWDSGNKKLFCFSNAYLNICTKLYICYMLLTYDYAIVNAREHCCVCRCNYHEL